MSLAAVASPPESAPVLRVVDVSKKHGSNWVLRGVSLEVAKGEVLAVIGPSGSGKTTLVRCINQLEPIDGGRIYLEEGLVGYRERNGRMERLSERQIAGQRTHIGMVFQRFNLFPHMDALANVMVGPLRVLHRPEPEVRPEAIELLRRVGLGEKLHAYPGQLSGGQQQRVAIARALAMRPKLMLFDEPTSELDPETVGEVLDAMRELAVSGTTMIVVTHEMGFARDVADHVMVMDAGVVIERGLSREVFARPAHERTRAFLQAVR
jgi:polar amino acid transport system ATP-binding protein